MARNISKAAQAAGITIDRYVDGYAYPKNGRAHTTTPRYRYEVRHCGKLVDTTHRHAEAVVSANEYAATLRVVLRAEALP